VRGVGACSVCDRTFVAPDVAEVDFGLAGRCAGFDRAFCWRCWAGYPERAAIARAIVDAFSGWEQKTDLFAEVTRVDSGVFYAELAGRPERRLVRALVGLPFATGCPAFFPLSTFGTVGWSPSDGHPVEIEALERLRREILVLVPTPDDLLNLIDWSAKQKLFTEARGRDAEETARRETARAGEEAACADQHDRTMRIVAQAREHGLQCPACLASSHAFRLTRMRNTAVICPKCGRSFHVVPPIPASAL
jgi:hypothetical protein